MGILLLSHELTALFCCITEQTTCMFPVPINFILTLCTLVYNVTIHREVFVLDRLLTFLMAISALLSKPSFYQNLSIHSHLSLPETDLLELRPLVVFGSHWWR